MPLTPADVHNVAFSKPPIGKRGYNEDEVDAFLDLVENELTRLIEENADLRQRVSELDSELASARAGGVPGHPGHPAYQPEPEPVERVAHGRRGGQPERHRGAGAQGRPGAQPGSGHRRPADRHGARAEADKMLADARANADQICPRPGYTAETTVDDASQRADAMLADAQSRSETQLRQAQEKADSCRPTPSASIRDHGHHQPAAHRPGGPPRAVAHLRARVPHPSEDLPGVPARGTGPAWLGRSGGLRTTPVTPISRPAAGARCGPVRPSTTVAGG